MQLALFIGNINNDHMQNNTSYPVFLCEITSNIYCILEKRQNKMLENLLAFWGASCRVWIKCHLNES